MYARENETVSDTCVWDVVFKANTGEEVDGGELPLLTSAFYNMSNSSFSTLDTSVTEVCRGGHSHVLKYTVKCLQQSCYRALDKKKACGVFETNPIVTVLSVSGRFRCYLRSSAEILPFRSIAVYLALIAIGLTQFLGRG